jgi:iron complex outermembrane receptor protein
MSGSRFVRAFRGAGLLAAGTSLADQAEAARRRGARALEEVVVTAQRREQNIQDVGIAVTPLGEKALEDLNITNATDIVTAVPSLKMNAYSSAQVVFNIRGVSQNDYGDQQEPPVAVYQDDSTRARSTSRASRCSTSRASRRCAARRARCSAATRRAARSSSFPRATDQFEGYTDLTYGSFNQTVIDGALSGPLSENVQGRIAFIYDKDDGCMESIIVPACRIVAATTTTRFAAPPRLAAERCDGREFHRPLPEGRSWRRRPASTRTSPACPNAQNQGEFTPADSACPFWGTGPGDAGTGFQDPAIIPSRGGDPYKTAEDRALVR